MKEFELHEQFEIEVLDKLKSDHLLQPLVFGGGTMLRLCHDLDRYSVDLDFGFIKEIDYEEYFKKTKTVLQKYYKLTDAQIKYYKLLLELKSEKYPKKLKIEIRKEVKICDFQEKIAYSKFSNIQVLLRTHTLQQSMKNKINALMDRNEIRDAFDIEFLIRKGIDLPNIESDKLRLIYKNIDSFKDNEFKVKLGSIIPAEKRNYYIKNRFSFLIEKLQEKY